MLIAVIKGPRLIKPTQELSVFVRGHETGVLATKQTSVRRCLMTLVFLASGWLSYGCVVVPSARHRADEPVSAIAGRLVHALELRTDLQSVRLRLHAFQETRARDRPVHDRNRLRRVHAIAEELELAFLVALSQRLHVVDPELARGETFGLPDTDADWTAIPVKATHFLIGSYIRRPHDRLVVSVRIVEAHSLLVVAASQGVIHTSPAHRRLDRP